MKVCVFVQARSSKLEHEVEKNKILSEALQTLATEHHELEQSVVKGSSPRSVLSEDEFYDALSGAYKCDAEFTSYTLIIMHLNVFNHLYYLKCIIILISAIYCLLTVT